MYEYWNIDWLAHHGILNQRWGHRNGPPYPLSREVSTGSRLKKGASGSIKKKKSKISPDKIYVKRPDNLSELNLNKSSDKEKQKAYDDVKEWLKEVYLEDDFDGYYDNKNPMSGTKGIDDWGSRELIAQAKYRLKKSGNDKNLSDKEIKQALVDAWNEHYNLPSENSKDKSFIDKHTITREPKSQTSTPRFGEVNKDGKVIRTNTDLINEAVERGLAENRRRMETAVNSNQDMFNDILDRTSIGGQTNLKKQSGQQWGDPRIRQAEKEFKDTIKRVAKESGVSKKQLEAKVTENYQKRQEEIRALDNKRHNNKETINRRLQNAKTRDQWDINFLEAVQNKPFTEQHITGDISDSAYKNKMLQEYKKYLEDPEKYWNSR